MTWTRSSRLPRGAGTVRGQARPYDRLRSPLTAPSLPLFPKSCYNLEDNQQSPSHHRGLTTSPIGGAARPHPPTPIFCNVAATRPACPSVRQAVSLQDYLGRPTNFPSMGAAWFPRRAARWQDDSSRWFCNNAGLGDITEHSWNMQIIGTFTEPFFIVAQGTAYAEKFCRSMC